MSDIRTAGYWRDGDNLIVGRSQDVAPLLQHCSDARSAGNVGSNEFRRAASFPKVLIEKYCTDHGITFAEWMANPDHVKRMLRDPALSGFRVWGGRV